MGSSVVYRNINVDELNVHELNVDVQTVDKEYTDGAAAIRLPGT